MVFVWQKASLLCGETFRRNPAEQSTKLKHVHEKCNVPENLHPSCNFCRVNVFAHAAIRCRCAFTNLKKKQRMSNLINGPGKFSTLLTNLTAESFFGCWRSIVSCATPTWLVFKQVAGVRLWLCALLPSTGPQVLCKTESYHQSHAELIELVRFAICLSKPGQKGGTSRWFRPQTILAPLGSGELFSITKLLLKLHSLSCRFLRMRNCTWNRFPIKNLLINSLLSPSWRVHTWI